MNDDLARRRRVKARKRVDADCATSLAAVRQARAVDDVAALLAASTRRHPSNGAKPYDREDET